MARRAEGTVLERRWKNGNGFALRFWALGERQYMTLGMEADGWTRERAETELANVMADVRRGLWVPQKVRRAKREQAAEETMPSFLTFAMQRFIRSRVGKVSKKTVDYERWALRNHLLPYFATWAMDEFDAEGVDGYRQFKVAQAAERAEAIERGEPIRLDPDDSEIEGHEAARAPHDQQDDRHPPSDPRAGDRLQGDPRHRQPLLPADAAA